MDREERKEHNKKVREERKEYSEQMKRAKEKIKNLRIEYFNSDAFLTKDILDIIEDIIQTQNRGVPLSSFQRQMLSTLEKKFKKLEVYEETRPELTRDEQSTYIENFPISSIDRRVNVTKLRVGHAGEYQDEKIQRLIPEMDSEETLDLISEVIANNAKMIKEIEKDALKRAELKKIKKVSDKDRKSPLYLLRTKKRSSFEIGLEKAANSAIITGTERSIIASALLSEILEEYEKVRDIRMHIEESRSGEKFLLNVPTLHRKDSKYVGRLRMHRVDLPEHASHVPMLPAGITAQLSEVLAIVLKENSQLHNILYKPKKIERKFPWKTVIASIAVLATLASTAAFIKHKMNEQDKVTEDKVADVIQGDQTQNDDFTYDSSTGQTPEVGDEVEDVVGGEQSPGNDQTQGGENSTGSSEQIEEEQNKTEDSKGEVVGGDHTQGGDHSIGSSGGQTSDKENEVENDIGGDYTQGGDVSSGSTGGSSSNGSISSGSAGGGSATGSPSGSGFNLGMLTPTEETLKHAAIYLAGGATVEWAFLISAILDNAKKKEMKREKLDEENFESEETV